MDNSQEIITWRAPGGRHANRRRFLDRHRRVYPPANQNRRKRHCRRGRGGGIRCFRRPDRRRQSGQTLNQAV